MRRRAAWRVWAGLLLSGCLCSPVVLAGLGLRYAQVRCYYFQSPLSLTATDILAGRAWQCMFTTCRLVVRLNDIGVACFYTLPESSAR